MNLFENGHRFGQCARCCPPDNVQGQPLPVPHVVIEMAGGDSDLFVSVTGKVDTGAVGTMLTFQEAHRLGIDNPVLPAPSGTARTATDERFPYYVHDISVQIPTDTGEPIEFAMQAAFAERVKRNLFGIDWLQHLCLAVDRQAVYFLRD